jgi:hypothetical protein
MRVLCLVAALGQAVCPRISSCALAAVSVVVYCAFWRQQWNVAYKEGWPVAQRRFAARCPQQVDERRQLRACSLFGLVTPILYK